MIDIQKQIDYWSKGSEEDWNVGVHLINEGSIRHGLFFIHLSIEKILKAHVCRKTVDLAPRTHNIIRLWEQSGLLFKKEDSQFLAILNKYNIEGRYPDSYEELPNLQQITDIVTTGERVYKWLRSQF